MTKKNIINKNYQAYGVINSEEFRKFLNIFYLAFAFLLCTVQFGNGFGSNGNVEQWINLTAQVFYGKQDFLFSYGPLFWLTGGVTTPYNSAAYVAALLFVSLFYALFWSFLIYLSIKKDVVVWVSISFLIFIKTLVFHPAYFMWAFLLIIYFEFKRINKINLNIWFYVGCICSLFLYIRFFWGVTAILTFGLYIVGGGLDFYRIKSLAMLLFGALFAYVILGLVIFHDTSSLLNYILINNQLSYGNSVDMVLDVVTNSSMWLSVLLIFISVNIYLLRERRNLFLVVNFLFLICLKLGFGRADHYLWFVGAMSLIMIFLLFIGSKQAKWTYIGCFTGLSILMFTPSYHGANVQKLINTPVSFKTEYLYRMKEVYKDYRLDAKFLEMIGSHSVDVYPYKNEYIYANGLNYKHRPIFQNYMTLTPKLDLMNKNFFESSAGPDFIIWTAGIACASFKCNPFESFDGKYSLNEDPLTVDTILTNYTKVALTRGLRGEPVILLKKKSISVDGYREIFQKGKFNFDDWIDVPDLDDKFIRIQPFFELTFFAKLKNLLFRGDVLKVKYLFISGEVKEYRLNIINSSGGVWASPILEDFEFSGKRPVKIMFVSEGDKYFKKSFDANWISFRVN